MATTTPSLASRVLADLAGQIKLFKRWNPRAFEAQIKAFTWARTSMALELACGHDGRVPACLVITWGEDGVETLVASIVCQQCGMKTAEVSLWPPLPSTVKAGTDTATWDDKEEEQ